MQELKKYINIHTHASVQTHEIAVRNVFLDDFFLGDAPSGSPISVGMHPWNIGEYSEKCQIRAGLETAAKNNSVLAIGETGLDKSIELPLDIQEDFFKIHIEISEVFQKPLIIHCVRAFQEILSIRKEMKPKQVWIFHGFNGSPQLARQIIDSGCMVSFGKSILNENTRATHSLLHLDAQHFFLETDNSIHSIASIYEMVSLIKQVPLSEIIEKINANFSRVFGR